MRKLGTRIGLIACILLIVAMAIQEWWLTQQIHVLNVMVTQMAGKYDVPNVTIAQMTGKYERPVTGESMSLADTSLRQRSVAWADFLLSIGPF